MKGKLKMCNCIKDTEKQLTEMVKDRNEYKKLESFRVVFPDVALSPNKDNVWGITYYLNFRAEGKYETKSGNVKTKKEWLNVKFAYCPLCGEKVEE